MDTVALRAAAAARRPRGAGVAPSRSGPCLKRLGGLEDPAKVGCLPAGGCPGEATSWNLEVCPPHREPQVPQGRPYGDVCHAECMTSPQALSIRHSIVGGFSRIGLDCCRPGTITAGRAASRPPDVMAFQSRRGRYGAKSRPLGRQETSAHLAGRGSGTHTERMVMAANQMAALTTARLAGFKAVIRTVGMPSRL